MEQSFKQSEPTGLSDDSDVALVAGDASTVYTVVSPGVSGRASWEGKRLWEPSKETGSWQATVGHQGARQGTVRLAKGVGTSRGTRRTIGRVMGQKQVAWQDARLVPSGLVSLTFLPSSSDLNGF